MPFKVPAKTKEEEIPRQVATKIGPDLGEKLLAFCRASNYTKSEVCRMALEKFLKNARVEKEGA